MRQKYITNLKQFRSINNLNQNELAKQIGISCEQMSRLENGRCQPSAKTILKICDFFGCSCSIKYDYENNEVRIKFIEKK